MKKSINLIFGTKIDSQISVFAFTKKAPSAWKHFFFFFFEKWFFWFTCADKIFKTVSGNFLKINGSWDNWDFGDYMVTKVVLHNKLFHKMWTKNDQEKSLVMVLETPLTYCVIHVNHIKAYCINAIYTNNSNSVFKQTLLT